MVIRQPSISSEQKTAMISAAEFSGNGFHTSLPTHCLIASGSLPPFTFAKTALRGSRSTGIRRKWSSQGNLCSVISSSIEVGLLCVSTQQLEIPKFVSYPQVRKSDKKRPLMWPVSGSSSRKTTATSAAEFAGNGLHTSLPSHCLTASGSLPPFT
ncbi:LOW QUALITY PROTEIN: hypothetical protein T265_12444, partial [Opisthorchis viverrini]